MEKIELKKGDVVQISPEFSNPIFRGALVMVEDPKAFGMQGFVNCLDKGNAYIRVEWKDMEYIGLAPFVPTE